MFKFQWRRLAKMANAMLASEFGVYPVIPGRYGVPRWVRKQGRLHEFLTGLKPYLRATEARPYVLVNANEYGQVNIAVMGYNVQKVFTQFSRGFYLSAYTDDKEEHARRLKQVATYLDVLSGQITNDTGVSLQDWRADIASLKLPYQ